ncbi:hypothetical protein Tco_0843825 [Tanacetum coccineum]
MKVEYKWKPSCCGDCHVFGHALENCPKRLVEPVKETNEENEEGFTTIKSHKRKDQDDVFTVNEKGETSRTDEVNTELDNKKSRPMSGQMDIYI